MLQISNAAEQAIRKHAVEGYPNEICGLLVGHVEGEVRTAWEAHPVPNRWEENPEARRALFGSLEREGGATTEEWENADTRRRFIIDARDQFKIFREARQKGMDLVGVYHTHPNHPAIPSKYDRAAAVEGWSYVIVSVRDGEVAEFRSWEIVETDGEFVEEAVAEE